MGAVRFPAFSLIFRDRFVQRRGREDNLDIGHNVIESRYVQRVLVTALDRTVDQSEA